MWCQSSGSVDLTGSASMQNISPEPPSQHGSRLMVPQIMVLAWLNIGLGLMSGASVGETQEMTQTTVWTQAAATGEQQCVVSTHLCMSAYQGPAWWKVMGRCLRPPPSASAAWGWRPGALGHACCDWGRPWGRGDGLHSAQKPAGENTPAVSVVWETNTVGWFSPEQEKFVVLCWFISYFYFHVSVLQSHGQCFKFNFYIKAHR